VLIVLGGIVALLAVAMLGAGGVALWGLGQRDGSGYFATKSHPLSTPSYALASESLDVGPDLPGGIGDFASVRLRAASARAVFVGIGRATDVQRYLRGVRHSEITDVDTDPFDVTSHTVPGTAPSGSPASQDFWRVQASGQGTQTVTWPVESGRWSAVVMNADGSRDVSVAVSMGARVPWLHWVAIVLLTAGGLSLVGAGALIYAGARRRQIPPGRLSDTG
jgi:hypothetical protein